MRSVRRHRRESEGGFALLLIFAFAAAVAIGIYAEMPRAVFESARAKEELLVERGEQYKLAIRRFHAKTKGYPQTIEQLEETNGVRFLRKRYKDPMTGKDEWRLVHIGPGGYTDSKVFKPQNPAEKKQVYESSISAGYSVGQAPAVAGETGIQGVAMRQRPGDQLKPPGQELPESPIDAGPDGPDSPPPPPGPEGADPRQQPPNPGMGYPPNQSPGALPPNPQNPGFPGQNSQQPPPGTFPPGISPGSGFPGMPRTLPAGPQNPADNPALRQIQGMLTSGRPNTGGGPAPGAVPTGAGGAPQGAAFVGGIAGVASKYEGEGIKRIHDRSRIDEWEFLFDASKQQNQNQAGGALAGGALPAGAAPMGGVGQNAAGSGVRPNAPAGAAPPAPGGFGGSTIFGPSQPPPGMPRPPAPPATPGNRPRP